MTGFGFGSDYSGASGGLGVPQYFAGRVGWANELHRNPFSGGDVADEPYAGEVIDIADLRERLTAEGVPAEPTLVTVRGVLFPCILLFPAYWERETGAGHEWIAWRDELQEWLFHGFEQWGPSWDVNPPGLDSPLLGQIGRGDELESILVVLEGDMARSGWAALGEDAAAEVEITGVLTRKRQLGEGASRPREWGTHFDYGLRSADSDPRHRVAAHGRPDTYSAYLWQCWAPAEQIRDPDEPKVDECFFAWEHTDVVKPAAVAYNLDSLARKAEYLRDRYGELLLLQNSSRLVPGQPRFPTERFESLLRLKSDGAS